MAAARCRKHHEALRQDVNGVPFCHQCRVEDELETRRALKAHDPQVLRYAALSAHAEGRQTLD